MASTEIDKHVFHPKILKNMKEYLGNPQTLKELYDTLFAVSMEEIYDWHEQEAQDARQLAVDLDKSIRDERNEKFAIQDILSAKSKVDRALNFLCSYYETQVKDMWWNNMKGYIDNESDFVNYCHWLQNFYLNCLQLFLQNFKKCSVEDVKRTISRIPHNMSAHPLSEIVKIFNLVIKKHVLHGDAPIHRAFVYLWDIHDEDITRPHMDLSQVPEIKWPWLILMLYIFGNISIEQLLTDVTVRINRNIESMQRYKTSYLWLYTRLREIYDDVEKQPSDTQVSLAPTEDTWLINIDNLPGDKQMKKMNTLHQEIQALRVIKETPPEILIQKLKPLRDMFSKEATQLQLSTWEEKKS